METASYELFGAELSWTAILTAIASVTSVFVLLKCYRHQQWSKKIQKARIRRDTMLQRAEQAVHQYKEKHPGEDTTQILSLSLAEVAKCLKDGSLTPATVFHSYMEKTLEINRRLNCCTEILLESFDQLKNIGLPSEGLLYGVPISIKDNVGYKGHDSSCGLLSNLDQPAAEDSVVVKVLKRQGAIPYVKTNVPQGLLSHDCSNPIYGQTLHPHSLERTPGGSSGGEGALIGGGASLLGIGSDIGGSIRIPSSFCGICGFKPTSRRLSLQGINSCCKGQKTALPCLGPMARDVDSLALCMRALLCDYMFSLDPTLPPIPFNQQVYMSSKRLKIGYFENDGYHAPSPSMGRGLRETKALLEKAGHTLVPFTPPRLPYATQDLVFKGFCADGGATFMSSLEGGPIDPSQRTHILLYSLPRLVKKTLSILIRPVFPRIADMVDAVCGVSSVAALWKHHGAEEDYTHEFIAEWRKCEMDVLICPALGPAFNLFCCGKLGLSVSSTILYNLLNCPAGVVPVSTVTAEDEEGLEHYKSNLGSLYDGVFKKAVTGAEGLPVAVQCVALPWQDELCLRLMREVEQLTRDNRK